MFPGEAAGCHKQLRSFRLPDALFEVLYNVTRYTLLESCEKSFTEGVTHYRGVCAFFAGCNGLQCGSTESISRDLPLNCLKPFVLQLTASHM